MLKAQFKVGDEVEVIGHMPYPLRGRILEIDSDPFEYDSALVEVMGAIGATQMWLNLRMARKV